MVKKTVIFVQELSEEILVYFLYENKEKSNIKINNCVPYFSLLSGFSS
jgi:hypothetical protein